MQRYQRKPQNLQGKNVIKEIQPIVSEKKKTAKFFIIIAFCIPVLLYIQTINFGFTYFDDNTIIKNNIYILNNFNNFNKVFLTDAFLSKSSSFYRPLQSLSYMLDILISGPNSTWMFHLSNILLFGLISLTFFISLKKLSISSELALLGILVYFTHPLFVSTVAWVPARGDLQNTLFSILSFLFFIFFMKERKYVYLFLTWITFTIALFCKETAVILPILFTIYFLTFSKDKYFDKKILFIIFLYFLSGLFWFLMRSNAIINEGSNEEIGLISFLSNLRTLPESITKFFIPYDNNPIPSFSLFKTLMGLIIIGLLCIFLYKNNRIKNSEAIFYLSWFLVLMLPPMFYKNPNIDYLDHRFFLPLMGVLILLLKFVPEKWVIRSRVKFNIVLTITILILSSITFLKSLSYSNPNIFYNTAIIHNLNSAIVYNNRGYLRQTENDIQGAIADYNKAIEINSNYADAYDNIGNIKMSQKDLIGAEEDYNKAISSDPNFAVAYNNRGYIKSLRNDLSGAMFDYNEAIKLYPTYYLVYLNRGYLKEIQRDYNGAIDDFNTAIKIFPNNPEAYLNRGNINNDKKDFSEAIEDYNKAIKLNPNYTDAYYNRAYVKNNIKDYKGALEDCNKVLEIKYNYEPAMKLKMEALQKLQN